MRWHTTVSTLAMISGALGGLSASAATINTTFQGTVTGVYSLGTGTIPTPLSQFSIGSPVTGSISYDPASATQTSVYNDPSQTTPTPVYVTYALPASQAGSGMSVTLGGYTWNSGEAFDIGITNYDQPTMATDQISVSYSSALGATQNTSLPFSLGYDQMGVSVQVVNAVGPTVDFVYSTQLPTQPSDVNTNPVLATAVNSYGYLLSKDQSGNGWVVEYSPIPQSFVVGQPVTTPAVPDVPIQTESFTLNVPGTNNTAATFPVQFDWGFNNQTLTFSIDIQLTGDVLAAQQYIPIWETGIERMWSDGATFSDGTTSYNFAFDVNFVSSGADYVVDVVNGIGHTSVLQWFLDLSGMGLPQDLHDETAAHEFGHMLGIYDEYLGGATDPFANPLDICRPRTLLGVPIPGLTTGTFCDSLMADHGPTQQRYYDQLLALLEGQVGSDLTTAMSPLGYYPLDPNRYLLSDLEGSLAAEPAPVPIPAPGALMAALLLSGLFFGFLKGSAGKNTDIVCYDV